MVGCAVSEVFQLTLWWNHQRLNFQYPRNRALSTFCSFSSRFKAVMTAAGGFRSCSARSRSLTITSPVGYRWWTLCANDEILSASDLNSFLLFCSARRARTPSGSKTRRHIAATPRPEMISASHQRSGIEEKTFMSNFMKLFRRTGRMQRIPSNPHDAKITNGRLEDDHSPKGNRQASQDRRRLLSEARAIPRLMSGTMTNSRTLTSERST